MTPEIRTAYTYGILGPIHVATAAARAHLPLPIALALVEGESPAPDWDHPNGLTSVHGGANIYGHDSGGVFSTRDAAVTINGVTYPKGSSVPVGPADAGVFLIRIAAGATSNGMGPCQITYAGELGDGRSGGMFRLMLEEGLLPWNPVHSMIYGFTDLANLLADGFTLAEAGAHYNGGTHPNASAVDYGKRLVARADAWTKRLP